MEEARNGIENSRYYSNNSNNYNLPLSLLLLPHTFFPLFSHVSVPKSLLTNEKTKDQKDTANSTYLDHHIEDNV